MAHRTALWIVIPLMASAGLVSLDVPAQAATVVQRVWTSAPASVIRGTTARITVTSRPIRSGRYVRVRYRRVGGPWAYLAAGRERSTGRAVISFRINRSGSYQVQATMLSYGALPWVRGAIKAVKVVPIHPPVVVAHRGGDLAAPENTMSAFELAVRNGATRLETDVQETSDGQLVLFHDRTLARTTDVAVKFPERKDAPLTSFTFAELETLDAGSYLSPSWAGERIPTFRALLDLARVQGVGVLAEAKLPDDSPGIEQLMVGDVHAAGLESTRQDDRVVFESFDMTSLRRFLDVDPGANVSPILSSFPDDLTTFAWADSITLNAAAATTARITAAHVAGLEVNVWTPDTAPEMALDADEGADALVTDDVTLANQVVH